MDPSRKRIRAEAAADAIASEVDEQLGRSEPESDAAADTEVRQVLPNSVRDRPEIHIVQRSVTAGSLGLAVVAFVFGNGSLSAVVSSASMAASRSGTLGAYLDFADAFILTLPLSVCVAAVAWLAFAGHIKSLGAVAVCVMGALAITYVAGKMAIDGPTMSEMGAALNSSGSNPILKAGVILRVYFEYYTVVPFLGGAITGIATGWACFRLHTPDQPT